MSWKLVEVEKANIEGEVGTKKNPTENFDHILGLKLSELAKRNMALEVFSEVLNENIWICSDEEMVNQITGDNPKAICYTAREMIELIKAKPTPEDVKRIHMTKVLFSGSRVVESELKEELDANE